jgi:CheY-like chemotaxis protein/anti-sigma regulatory factor (Ser/Thr protein kinase)
VLLVEDDELLRMLIGAQLEATGYEVVEAEDIEGALHVLGNPLMAARLDAMVLDRALGDADGLTLACRMKATAEWKQIPIIMLTAYNKPQQMREGLEAGVFYYLGKPVQQPVLISVLARAGQEVARQRLLQSEMRRHCAAFALMESACFHFSTLEHAEQISCFIANCFPDPQRVLTGIAELMVNAIEHGLLGIGYEEKGVLLAKGTWRGEIEQRLPQAGAGQCQLIFSRGSDGCSITIRDPGKGFAWRDYFNFDPARAAQAHGRGIVQAASCFDRLTFNEAGNEVIGFLDRETV